MPEGSCGSNALAIDVILRVVLDQKFPFCYTSGIQSKKEPAMGYRVVDTIDVMRNKYSARAGLEGPFNFQVVCCIMTTNKASTTILLLTSMWSRQKWTKSTPASLNSSKSNTFVVVLLWLTNNSQNAIIMAYKAKRSQQCRSTTAIKQIQKEAEFQGMGLLETLQDIKNMVA
jgi:hypothetical protein